MADEALAQHGHVDILINNAGRSIRRSITLLRPPATSSARSSSTTSARCA